MEGKGSEEEEWISGSEKSTHGFCVTISGSSAPSFSILISNPLIPVTQK